MKAICIGGLDIGGTKMAATVAGPEGPLARLSRPTVKSGTERALPEQALVMLEEVCELAGVDPRQVAAVGVASAGPFVPDQGMLGLSSPNICGGLVPSPDLPNDWKVVPLELVLRERYDTLKIENDCVAALSAERSFGAVMDQRDCVYVTWSTGIGFGLCVDGNILRGKHGNAGHAGHMLLSEREDAICGCGNRGDLEALASGRNIRHRFGTDTVALFRAAREGETEAREAVMEAAQWFGRGLYNLAATLDTRVFVIGGSVWQHHGEWLTPIVEREISQRLPALTAGVSIVPAALGSLVTDIGALSLVMPAEWLAAWRVTQPWHKL